MPDRRHLARALGFRRSVVTIAVVAILFALPFLIAEYELYIGTRIVIFALFAMGFNLVFGYGGMHSLGHAAFFGIGAYTLGLGIYSFDLPAMVLIPLGIVLGALMGVVWGVLSIRVSGVYFLLLTLALGQLLWALASQLVGVTGGDNGVSNLPRGGLPEDTVNFYWLALGLTVVSVALLWVFQQSPRGMAIVVLRESRVRTAASGYSLRVVGAVSFGVSGAICALAGSLNTAFVRAVTPDSLHWLLSATVMVYAIVGGSQYFFGPAVGAALLIVLEVVISPLSSQWVSVLGIIYIVVALVLKEGILGKLATAWATIRKPARTELGTPLALPQVTRQESMKGVHDG